jgi:hypothetical protein
MLPGPVDQAGSLESGFRLGLWKSHPGKLVDFHLAPSEQALANVLRIEAHNLADVGEGKRLVAIGPKNPFFGLAKQPQSPSTPGRKMFLKARQRVFQHRQHEPFLRLGLDFSAKVIEILDGKKAIGLKQRSYLIRVRGVSAINVRHHTKTFQPSGAGVLLAAAQE